MVIDMGKVLDSVVDYTLFFFSRFILKHSLKLHPLIKKVSGKAVLQ